MLTMFDGCFNILNKSGIGLLLTLAPMFMLSKPPSKSKLGSFGNFCGSGVGLLDNVTKLLTKSFWDDFIAVELTLFLSGIISTGCCCSFGVGISLGSFCNIGGSVGLCGGTSGRCGGAAGRCGGTLGNGLETGLKNKHKY